MPNLNIPPPTDFLAHIHQQLTHPIGTLKHYISLSAASIKALKLQSFITDFDKILQSSQNLQDIHNGLLDPKFIDSLFNGVSLKDAERALHHDLRTPLSGIRGYSEIILHNLNDMVANHHHQILNENLNLLIKEVDALIQSFSSIIHFSTEQPLQNTINNEFSEAKEKFKSIQHKPTSSPQKNRQSLEKYSLLMILLLIVTY